MSRSSKPKKRAGLPGSMHWPGWNAIFSNMWDKSKNAVAFPPKVFGYGWSLNFAYPLIRSKPLWKRVLVFLLGLFAILAIVYLLIVLGLLTYYALRPAEQQVYTIVIE